MEGICEPCKHRSQDRNAKYFCKDCKEFLCSSCRYMHQSVILAKNEIRKETDMKRYCEICMENDEKNEAIAFCLDCNPQEFLCSDCVKEHATFRRTRKHRIEYSLEADVTNISPEPNVRFKKAFHFFKKEQEKPQKDQPGQPTIYGVEKADSFRLRWNPPRSLYKEHQYQLRYKTTSPPDKWQFYHENSRKSVVLLEQLKSDSTFIFQVRMVNNEKEGPYSIQSDPIRTKTSAAIRLKGNSKKLENPGSCLEKRKLLLKETSQARNENAKTRQFVLGSPNNIKCYERTIMLVGATGSGKSTLVDGFINYILGVNWDDPFRFTLIDLEEDERKVIENQAISQTQWITTYCIHPSDGSRLDYRLNIIDTPGFGDTSGLERDKQIVDQIRKLFSASDGTGEVFLDAVCFVTKAPDGRLTPTQNYIFNAILSLFGQDIADNIKILITFADGKPPAVLAALKQAKLPHEPSFQFNNSSLFSDNSGPNMSSFSPMFWEMGCKSFKFFFDHLKTMKTKSLKQTKEVLLKRQEMQLTIDNLMPLVSNGLNKMDELKIEINIIEQHKTEIKANNDFKYTVTETRQVKQDLPIGIHVTNCLHCNYTCHNECAFSRDEDKIRCVAMDSKGNCTQCQEKCNWIQHANTPYIFDYETVQVNKTYREKKEKYRKATDEKMTQEVVVRRMWKEVLKLQTRILQGMSVVTECSNVLNEIALKPNPLSVKEHIDLLIEDEKQEKREGFQRRITSLMECRQKCLLEDDVKRLQLDIKKTKGTMGNIIDTVKKGLLNFFG